MPQKRVSGTIMHVALNTIADVLLPCKWLIMKYVDNSGR